MEKPSLDLESAGGAGLAVSKTTRAEKSPVKTPPSTLVSFKRSQIASLAATVVDFGTLVFSVEILHIHYVAATAIGAFLGALTNFQLGRHWSFEAHEKPVQGQATRYAVVSGISLLLNSGGVYVFTEFAHFKYTVSKLVTAFLVGIFFNFPMHRRYVFK
ncbi:MAG: GtrA family protein [Methylotenera sp.]|nr:GtrA family protein [Oligoflexia bacterium]